MKIIPLRTLVIVGALISTGAVRSEVSSFGGDAEQFVGDGDLVPPACTLDVPKLASSPFFVKWDCTDNLSTPDQLRSELWIKPKGQPISRKVKDFLGFPAAIEVNEGLLTELSETKVTTTSDTSTDSSSTSKESALNSFFPIEVRLIVRDRGGASAISEVQTVLGGESLSCDITVKTESVEASGESSGTPSLEASVSSVDGANSGGGLQSLGEFSFSSCDIEELCQDDPKYSFSISSSGTFSLIKENGTFGGKGTLKEDEGSSNYSGTLVTNDSGTLDVAVVCK